MHFELSVDFLDQIKASVNKKDSAFISENLSGLHAADINLVLMELDTLQSKYIIDLLDDEISAEIISELDSDIRKEFLETFTAEEVVGIIKMIDSDDAADILNEQGLKFREEILSKVSDHELLENLQDLLRYDEDCAGGLMAKELVKANSDWTVSQCIEEIKRQAEEVDKLYSIYVVNSNEKLIGRVSLKKILLAPNHTKIEDLYEEDIISVDVFMPEDELVQLMSKYDLDAVPVVNVQNKLVGRITIDDVVDVITEQAEKERNLMAGISENVETNDSIWELTRARLPWLLIGVLGGLLSAMLMGVFEEELQSYAAIAFFIPLITATGGNVGIQSSSIIVQSLVNKTAFDESTSKTLFKSFLVSLMNGTAICLVVVTFVFAFKQEVNLSIVVGIAIFTVVIIASLMGTVTPIILSNFGVNPAVASGPFITTANDILGIAIYFSVVHLLIISPYFVS